MVQSNNPNEWLRRAKSNLFRAKESEHLDLREIAIEDLFFDAQQCTEKSLKAVLVGTNIDFPHTHDLARLLTIIKKNSINIPDELLEAAELTVYAFITRYPGDRHPLSMDDLEWAVGVAEKVYNWAKNTLQENCK